MASVAAGDLNPDTSTTERERDMAGLLIHGPGVARSPLFTQAPRLSSLFFLHNSNPTVFLRAERDRITLFRCP
jgi:hypothetical protein